MQANYFKKAIVFDLDGTLTLSKTAIDDEISSLLCKLLEKKIVAIVSGGSYGQFKKQFLSGFKCKTALFKNLALFPTSGSSGYLYRDGNWQKVYEHVLSNSEKKSIKNAFSAAFLGIGYPRPLKIYGAIIEDRGAQITFSALGQKAPLQKKKEWNKKKDRRLEIKKELEKRLPDFEVRIGGLTSIDVGRKGINKAYAVEKVMDIFNLLPGEIVFVGDALYEGGNDFEVIRAGINTVPVSGPEETKHFIKTLLIL